MYKEQGSESKHKRSRKEQKDDIARRVQTERVTETGRTRSDPRSPISGANLAHRTCTCTCASGGYLKLVAVTPSKCGPCPSKRKKDQDLGLGG